MRFKYSVAILLFLAVIGVVVFAMPAAAVQTDNSATVNGAGGYQVTFVKTLPDGIRPMAVGSISQGQYQWAGKVVNTYTESVQFDLYWGNPSNSLRLRIFSPDGYVFGPYYDGSDSAINGNIYVIISRSGGVAQGTWYQEVYGDRVSGSQSYSI